MPLIPLQTADEKSAFRSYFYLFSRLYPCGECAAHFQALLKDYPPQVGATLPRPPIPKLPLTKSVLFTFHFPFRRRPRR